MDITKLNRKSNLHVSDMSQNSNASFLNEMESWRDLNKIKKRGKYLTAYPEVENYYINDPNAIVLHLYW